MIVRLPSPSPVPPQSLSSTTSPWPPTGHAAKPAADTQHDAVLDYYGRRLATCSSDKTIKIFEIEGDSHRLTETLKGYVMPLLVAFVVLFADAPFPPLAMMEQSGVSHG